MESDLAQVKIVVSGLAKMARSASAAFLFVTEDRDRVDSRCSSSRKIAGGQRCNQ
jgi:hypothetical protein